MEIQVKLSKLHDKQKQVSFHILVKAISDYTNTSMFEVYELPANKTLPMQHLIKLDNEAKEQQLKEMKNKR